MMSKWKYIGVVFFVSALMLLTDLGIAFAMSKLSGVLTGRESLFIAGVVSACLYCAIVSVRYPVRSVSICFISTFVTSSVLSLVAMFSLNVLETFLIPVAYYVICLVGLVVPLWLRDRFLVEGS